MKLKQYTPQDFPKIKGRSEMTFCANGSIKFSKAALFQLKVKQGSQLVFLQDEEKQQDWYITTVEKGGFEVSGNTTLFISNKGFVNFLSAQLKVPAPFKIRLGETQDSLTTLITAALRK